MNDLMISALKAPSIATSPGEPSEATAVQAAQSFAAGATSTQVKTAETYREFEAVFLQSFVEAMMPDNAESLFGKGLAGDTWKSFLAEKVAHKLAESGQIGLAEDLAAAAPRHGGVL